MTTDPTTPLEALFSACAQHGIAVLSQENGRIQLPKGYEVEPEQGMLFKLWWENTVVAPFDDPDELCRFIKMAM